MAIVQLFLYLSIVVLVVGIVAMVIKISRMPVHLRWDLYPIPHEKGKAQYGGSYYEESNWWTKPREVSYVSEIKEMGKEIFAIQSLYRHNRPLWYFSLPFHIGLYLLIGFMGFLFLGALLQGQGIEIALHSVNIFGMSTFYLTLYAGVGGWILGGIGSLGLLLSRILKRDLRNYSTRADYFNLILLLALFLSGFFAWLTVDRSFSMLRGFVLQFAAFEPARALPTIITVQLYLIAVFFIYLPFTHMTHFVGKYFTYHKVRWQDEPSSKGGKIETAVNEALGKTQNWSASHIKGGHTWADAAADSKSPSEKGEK